MVETNDSRFEDVIRQVIKGSGQCTEQMLIFDMLERDHMDNYIKSTLQQIDKALELNKVAFMKKEEYKQAINLYQGGEVEYSKWMEKHGMQVKASQEHYKSVIADNRAKVSNNDDNGSLSLKDTKSDIDPSLNPNNSTKAYINTNINNSYSTSNNNPNKLNNKDKSSIKGNKWDDSGYVDISTSNNTNTHMAEGSIKKRKRNGRKNKKKKRRK